jgi:hypothetical protein
MKGIIVFILLFILIGSLVPVMAQEQVDDSSARIKALEEKLEVLQNELKELKEKQQELQQSKKADETVNKPVEEPVVSLPTVESSQNPSISVIGELIWKMNHNKHVDGDNPFNLSALEIAIQSAIDPHSRADIFFHYKDGQIEAEEAYATLYRVPFDFLQTKAGKFKTSFGKVNAMHHHEQPWVDTPYMIQNFFGEEGISGTGLSAKAVIPLGDVYSELILQGFNDENKRSFSGGTSGKLLYNGRFRAYMDLTDASNLELGLSHLQGYNNADCTGMTKINGLDLTYRWRPGERAKYNSLLLRGEALFSERQNPHAPVINSKGCYGFAQYQLNRNWYLGGRYDYSEFPDLLNAVNEKAWSAILTYYPSEFMSYRLQYKSTERSYASKLNGLFLQLQFNIGPHGAHEF